MVAQKVRKGSQQTTWEKERCPCQALSLLSSSLYLGGWGFTLVFHSLSPLYTGCLKRTMVSRGSESQALKYGYSKKFQADCFQRSSQQLRVTLRITDGGQNFFCPWQQYFISVTQFMPIPSSSILANEKKVNYQILITQINLKQNANYLLQIAGFNVSHFPMHQ